MRAWPPSMWPSMATHEPPGQTPRRASHDARDWALDEALAQSFPASDPPAMIEPGSAIERILPGRVLGVDINPQAVRSWQDQGHAGAFGDIADPEFLATLPLTSVEWIIATMRPADGGVSHPDARIVLLQQLRALGYAGRIAVTSTGEPVSDSMLEGSADLVLTPFADAADYVARHIRTISPTAPRLGD